jgi:ABC-type sugar transport system ATPase subunit
MPKLARKLQTLYDVGLGYVKIGQSSTTLSGGEAQRVKLATELSKRPTGRTIYILDEPTTGLHSDDVAKLLTVLNRLCENGNTVLVIEHNLDVIKTADHIIDLGPEGGDGGGTVVVTGTPEEVAMAKRVRELQNEGSYDAVKAARARGEVDFDYSVACKFLRLEHAPAEKDLYVSCIGFGEVALVGFPGEPFTEIGRQTKAASPFKLTMTACMANGGEGYFPMKEIYYDGGYEASTSNYKVGTAEKLIETAIELVNELKN